jgi:hypothetical protein
MRTSFEIARAEGHGSRYRRRWAYKHARHASLGGIITRDFIEYAV